MINLYGIHSHHHLKNGNKWTKKVIYVAVKYGFHHFFQRIVMGNLPIITEGMISLIMINRFICDGPLGYQVEEISLQEIIHSLVISTLTVINCLVTLNYGYIYIMEVLIKPIAINFQFFLVLKLETQ